ncbi:MAG: hypothetical protein MUF49_01510 [Oculatellaceae cyanobacterium Prado106]|jgi:hypothetical protein|nr:hypothetical protein [Oculatellaceae cyanobacterium Prado106]
MKTLQPYQFWGGLMLAFSLGLAAGIGLSLSQPAAVDPSLNQAFAIYGTDAQQTAAQVDLYVNFTQETDSQQQLNQLADTLSRLKFCNLPIEVTEVQNQIATVNLGEHPWHQNSANPSNLPGCSGVSWRSQYFQGSAGGHDTTVTLARTFLQPERSGRSTKEPWIEGVQFTYQGKPIEAGQWDHINLDGVITRENLPE